MTCRLQSSDRRTSSVSGQTDSIVVYEPALKRLGLARRPWKDLVREIAEAVLNVEKDWIAHGVDVDAEGGSRKDAWRGVREVSRKRALFFVKWLELLKYTVARGLN